MHAALNGECILGLIRAEPRRVYARRATRGRLFARMVFADDTGEEFDWIVPEVATADALLGAAVAGELPDAMARRTLESLRANGLLLIVGLTRTNNRSPCRFRGCHPLVVGVHPGSPRE